MSKKNELPKNFKEVINLISTIISWTIFVLLIICAIFLLYYFIAMRVYVAKGSGYEPKFALYTIISPSMVPNINVYDVIVDTKVEKPEDIKINDVITFNSNLPEVHGSTITHRVIAISKDNDGKYYYQTKGDNNLVEDGINVPFESVAGKVALKIPGLGKVQSFMATKAGWLILILIPALYIIVKDIFKILKLEKKPNKEEANNVKADEKTIPEVNNLQNLEEKAFETSVKSSLFTIEDDDDYDGNLPKLKWKLSLPLAPSINSW